MVSWVKHLPLMGKTQIVQVVDYEGNQPNDRQTFLNMLNDIHRASQIKQVDCQLGYSNLTFELWILLHKIDYRVPLNTKAQYLEQLNRAFHKNFETLKKYKQEKNFQSVLQTITLIDAELREEKRIGNLLDTLMTITAMCKLIVKAKFFCLA